MDVKPTVARVPRGRIRDGLLLLRQLGSSEGGLPDASMFPDGADVLRWSALGRHYVVSRSPRHVEQVFVRGHDTYDKAVHYRLLAAVVGQGLLTSEGAAWERQRRLIQPVLGRRQIDGLVPEMVAATADFLDGREWTGGDPVDVAAEMTEATLDVVGRAVLGRGLREHVDDLRPAVSDGMAIALIAARLQLVVGFSGRLIDLGARLIRRLPMPPPLHHVRRVMRTIDDVVVDLIEQRERAGTGSGADLLDLLLTVRDESGQPIPSDLVRDELVTMLLAGHETTANALSWLWYLLARNPGAYQRHLDEVDAVLGGRVPTPDDLDRLIWTRACLQEAMRLYPPAWVLEREANEATELDGQRIPRRTTIIFPIHLIHRDPRWWPDAESFLPERFLPEAPHPKRGTYLPFGAGRRVCVAASFALTEGTLIAAMTSQRYRFRSEGDAPVGESATVTLRPAGGLPLHVTTRGSGSAEPAVSDS